MNSYLTEYYIEDIQKYLSLVLSFFAVGISLFYLYLINSSVLNAMVREQNDREISGITVKISALENNYITRKSDLNIDMAHSLGFRDDFSKVHFSNESPNVSGSLSLLGNEI